MTPACGAALQRLEQAERCKQEGNRLYAEGDLDGAVVSAHTSSLCTCTHLRRMCVFGL
jgi:hypothetical protein